ncbi:transcriptional regulator [Candidatus Curtissbacteria bacterium RIFOXYB1_FULL_41_59]|uniref:Transcriptional regulator n=1 Tax=Candidatus Curtissbacteria bacterium RIFOXYA1_FULL_41_14 TaxID=1797737 RepID=A0A1F5HC73_9BACT|nr:MAG: Transcriptional regulator, XRE family [Candidatus Levybacteria bacterium GW2011_GWA2_37_36]KKR61704.1 MAG: Transcriptional regulator, XRE family [Microgenomates group bacterium GW2011_GWC1_40_35]KKR76938.1 MAG: Transcriptional regulator, XRE family [Candidatus Curtissbacteria bacterium GW2011_GWD1_40_8]KKS01882.1 MAG: Transcriptional regulator, XRE family [Candidatus Curtissbacteria bacterium GW2011_GWC2_41_21]OGD79825.1 MAG: transcriptional regulator [Candidatus Curtissbacteria bacteri
MIQPKDRKHLDFNTWKKQVLKDPELKAEYDRQQPEFAVIRAIVRARSMNGISQEELAKKLGTKQSVISRLESGRANPSIGFLKKLAQALNSHLEIKFTP